MSRRVVIVAFEGFQLLDLAGPADVFALADDLARAGQGHAGQGHPREGHPREGHPREGYTVEVTAPTPGPIRAGNGVTIVAEPLAAVTGRVDTLLVVGGPAVPEHLKDAELIGHVTRLAQGARRVASVCNGAFLLAEAGLLDGRRATTHWLVASELADGYQGVQVDPDPIYVRDGVVWTSAGVTTGIDLALALVAEDHGHELARGIARGLVVYLHRPGGQSQFSTPMRAKAAPREAPIRELLAHIDAEPGADLSVPALAARAGMSERHFARVFTRETGLSPGRYVERSRGEAARHLLEVTAYPLDRVARESGLGTAETLYRVFRRLWRTSPGDYRRRFRTDVS